MTDSGQISVLVVDDEAPNIDSLRRIFEREGILACSPRRAGRNALDVVPAPIRSTSSSAT